MENKFVKVRSVKDIIIFSVLIILGASLLFIKDSPGANLGGVSLFALGLVFMLFLKSAYKEIESGDKFLRKEFYFPQEMKSHLISALVSNPSSIKVDENGNSQSLKLLLYYSKKSNKVYAQLFHYVPNHYEECSELFEYDFSQVDNLIK